MLYFSGKSGPSAWSSSYFPLSGLSTYFSVGSDLILPAHANRNASVGTVWGMSREKRPRQGDEVGRLKSGSLRCFARPQLPHFIHWQAAVGACARLRPGTRTPGSGQRSANHGPQAKSGPGLFIVLLEQRRVMNLYIDCGRISTTTTAGSELRQRPRGPQNLKYPVPSQS